jgi:formyltetrahydrofolate deformylase
MPTAARLLLVECPDRPGLVHAITGVLLRHGVNVVGNQEFVDRDSNRFFMRTEFDGPGDARQIEADVHAALSSAALVNCVEMDAPAIVLFATREHHCLGDLLVRRAHGELNARIMAVIANRPDLETLTARFDLPFHCIPSEDCTREQHEDRVQSVLAGYSPDFLVLAKYMRVLSPEFVARYPDRIINIHHSFLPAFAGARPYHQAFARGVKVIGATAHFVTADLDNGPIITQQVLPVDHTHTAADLAVVGRDVERLALSRALKLVFERRIFISGRRTVIFD